MKAEVVGFVKDAALLTPLATCTASAAPPRSSHRRAHMVPVGSGLLGRVLDGLGRPWTRPSAARCKRTSSTRVCRGARSAQAPPD